MVHRKTLFILIATGVLTLSAYSYWRNTRISFADLPRIDSYVNYGIINNTFRVDPYVKVVQHLQAMGRKAACEKLLELTKDDHVWMDNEQQITILCQMLFSKRQDSKFGNSWRGKPSFIGGTSEADWPLEPIELVDGTPLVVTPEFEHGAYYGETINYAAYCINNCDWSDYKFTTRTKQQKSDALSKLLTSPKWKRPLNQEERAWLASQIQ